MKIAVMGAGAVGCYYGGMLARAGNEVVLIGRAQHVAAIRKDGLLIETQTFSERVALQADTAASALAGADLVLCCVKSTDTAQAAADMAPYLAPDSLLLSLQNGVDNADRLGEALQRPVEAVAVYVATEMAGPGHVRHHGRGELVLGPSAASPELLRVFAAAGIPVEVSDNVVGALWAKLILNCAYNAISAITQLPYGVMTQGVGVREVMHDAVNEALAVARAGGIVVPGDTWQAVAAIERTMPQQCSSTAQDLARRKPSEIDHLNGHIVSRGAALGVPTPVNRVLHALVRLLEAR